MKRSVPFPVWLMLTWAASAAAQPLRHYLYAVDKDGPSILYVYDVDNGFALVQQTSIPTTYTGIDARGLVASAPTGALYISHGCYYVPGGPYCAKGGGYLAKVDIASAKLLWERQYAFGIDSHAISPDGKTVYMPTGENSGSSLWEVIETSDGGVVGVIDSGQVGAHNTIVSNDGSRLYMGATHATHFVAADTASDSVAESAGPTQQGVRPFTIDSTGRYAFLTETGLLGFQVADLTAGTVLYTASVGATYQSTCASYNPCSHGITLSPDDREIYVVDIANDYVHVFDVSGVPSRAPVGVADLPLAHKLTTTGWLTHSRDGQYVFVGGSGDVISTTTRQVVGFIPALGQTEHFVEVDYAGGDYLTGTVAFTPLSRAGVGYGDGGYVAPDGGYGHPDSGHVTPDSGTVPSDGGSPLPDSGGSSDAGGSAGGGTDAGSPAAASGGGYGAGPGGTPLGGLLLGWGLAAIARKRASSA